MNHGKSTHTRVGNGGGSMKGGGGGVLRDLLSSVTQQVESHLHPSSSSPGTRHIHVGRRPSRRIRSWIGGHDKDKHKNKDADGLKRSNSADHSLRFTDTSDDDFQVASDNISTYSGVSVSHNKNKEEEEAHRNDARECHEHQNAAGTNTDNAAKMHMLPDETREEETVDMLTGLMGDGFDREVARRILRKYGGDADKAAGALLEGERGEEFTGSGPAIQGTGGSTSGWSTGQTQTQTPLSQTPQTRLVDAPPSALAGRPNTPVIDLTLDDDPDLQRAMHESMNTLHSGSQSLSQVYAPSQGQDPTLTHMQAQSQPERPVFGPSERPSDSNWAVVPSQHVRGSLGIFWQEVLLTIGSCVAKRKQRCELLAKLESCYRSELGDDGGLGCARAISCRAAATEGWMVSTPILCCKFF